MESNQLLSIRLERTLIKVMEKDMTDFHYPTKSDFLREAIREKHLKLDEERRKEILIKELEKVRGSLKGKNISNKSDRQIRTEVYEEFMQKFIKKE